MKRLTIKSLMICVFISIGLYIGFTALSIGQDATTEEESTNETPWDVNGDRVVNVLDLVIVGQNFGTDNPVADVNGDGTVNILDLVLVAQHFGETIPEPEPIAQYIYWTEWGSGKIRRANLDGSNVQDIVDTGYFPVGIAVDLSAEKIYWTDKTSNDHFDPNATTRVARSNTDGSNIEILRTESTTSENLFTYFQIAVDSTNGKIYWTRPIYDTLTGLSTIKCANLDGSNERNVITDNASGPSGITLDPTSGKLYWTDCRNGKIQRANLDGSNVENIITVQECLHGLTLDVVNDKIYWANWNSGSINRANLDGTNAEKLVTDLMYPAAIALDFLNSKMYWTEHSPGKLSRANFDGSDIEVIFTELSFPMYLTITGPSQ